MTKLHNITGDGDLVAVNATTAPFPPLTFAYVPDSWRSDIPTMVDIDLLASGASGALTDLKAWAGRLRPLTVADSTFTTTHAANTLTDASHGLETGDGPVRLTNAGGALPAGLAVDTDYYIIKVDANTMKLATSRANAALGTAIDLTGDGTGTHTMVDTTDTKKVHWRQLGIEAATLSLASARDGYTFRVDHNSRVIGYAVQWTGTASNPIEATVSPVVLR